MDIKLYNTLTRDMETFKPQKEGSVGLYDCGPTVYNDAHIGNLRAYVFADTLRRTLEANGYTVTQVINITDVGHLTGDSTDEGEDKMTKALRRLGRPLTLEAMHDVGTLYFERFVKDMRSLNIELPKEFPRASDHIAEDIELVKRLETQGYAYTISNGVYFDTKKFKGYGKLGGFVFDTSKVQGRISSDPEKRSPSDFTLWKFDPQLGWDSPWGKGFPGWHIECSVMSTKYLGQPFDIHTGGIDHIPVHHNNEIAQSEAAYDKPLANYWMHNAFVNMDDEKMAKSTGNFTTLGTLSEESISPLSYRYWLLTAHYRSPVNFTYEAVRAAQNALMRLNTAVMGYPAGGKAIQAYKERFMAAVNDDLDTPQALALTWELVRDDKVSDADKKATLLDFDRVLGLKLGIAFKESRSVSVPEEVQALIDEREEAREKKDWKKADKLRKEIEEKGFVVSDSPEGVKVTAK